RRAAERRPDAADTEGGADLTVLLGGREAALPQEALTYAEGRALQAVSHAR
ncbi:glutamate racemase, partial [Streptomyces sp. GXMU-J5]|nr:glutamate racemase [Streptomyces beihaiensis]